MLQRASSVGIYKQVEPQLLCGQHWELWVPVYCPLFSTRAGFPPTGRELNTASAMDSKTRLADKNYSNYFLHVPGLCIACRPILLPIVETQTGIAVCCVAQQMRRFPQPSSIHKSRKPPQPMGAPSAVAAIPILTVWYRCNGTVCHGRRPLRLRPMFGCLAAAIAHPRFEFAAHSGWPGPDHG